MYSLQKTSESKSKATPLHKVQERRLQVVNAPVMMMSGFYTKYLLFHLTEVLPILDKIRMETENYSEEEMSYSKQALLLHSRNAIRLITLHLRNYWRTFILGVDTSLSPIKMMDLRLSYALLMVTLFKTGKLTRGKDDNEFLLYLASLMNISFNQVKYVCNSPLQESYMDVVKELPNGLVPSLDGDVENDTEDES